MNRISSRTLLTATSVFCMGMGIVFAAVVTGLVYNYGYRHMPYGFWEVFGDYMALAFVTFVGYVGLYRALTWKKGVD